MLIIIFYDLRRVHGKKISSFFLFYLKLFYFNFCKIFFSKIDEKKNFFFRVKINQFVVVETKMQLSNK